MYNTLPYCTYFLRSSKRCQTHKTHKLTKFVSQFNTTNKAEDFSSVMVIAHLLAFQLVYTCFLIIL